MEMEKQGQAHSVWEAPLELGSERWSIRPGLKISGLKYSNRGFSKKRAEADADLQAMRKASTHVEVLRVVVMLRASASVAATPSGSARSLQRFGWVSLYR